METPPQSYFVVIARQWKILAVITLIPTLLAIILVFFVLEPVYEGKATVIFPLKRASSFMRRSLTEMDIPIGIMAGILETTPTLYNHIAIMESRTLALRVNEYVREEKNVDLLSTYPDIQNNTKYRSEEERLRALAERMQSRIRVEDSDRGLAEVMYQHTNPRIAAELANAYVSQTLSFLNEVNRSTQTDLVEFLEARQIEVESQLEASEAEIEIVKTETGILAVEATAEQLIRSYADIEALVTQAEIDYRGSRTRAQAMADAGTDMQDYYEWLAAGNEPEGDPPVPLMEALGDQTVVRLRTELSELELQRQQILLWATPDNPQVVALEHQIDAVTRELYREISDYSDASVAGFMVESAAYEAQLQVAESILSEIDARLEEFPPDQRRLIELERSRQVYEAIYLVLTQELEQSRIQELREETPFTVLDEALVPTKPVRPRKLVLTLGTFAISLWIGIFAAFSVDALRRRAVPAER